MTNWRTIFILITMAGFLSACGVNGRPQLPPGVKKQDTPQVKDEKSVLDGLIE